jgi:hypothetical protein
MVFGSYLCTHTQFKIVQGKVQAHIWLKIHQGIYTWQGNIWVMESLQHVDGLQ